MNAVLVFVHFDDDQARNKSSQGELIEEGVGDCSMSLLLDCVGWLEDEGALSE